MGSLTDTITVTLRGPLHDHENYCLSDASRRTDKRRLEHKKTFPGVSHANNSNQARASLTVTTPTGISHYADILPESPESSAAEHKCPHDSYLKRPILYGARKTSISRLPISANLMMTCAYAQQSRNSHRCQWPLHNVRQYIPLILQFFARSMHCTTSTRPTITSLTLVTTIIKWLNCRLKHYDSRQQDLETCWAW